MSNSSASTSALDIHAVVSAKLAEGHDHEDYTVEELPSGTHILTEWGPKPRQDVTSTIQQLGYPGVTWHFATPTNSSDVVDAIMANGEGQKCVLALIDGRDDDGWGGPSVLDELVARGIPFTGTSPSLLRVESDKSVMKDYLMRCGTLTPKAVILSSIAEASDDDIRDSVARLRMPIIVKPACTSGSEGITDKSVCQSAQEALQCIRKMSPVYGHMYVEEYISGREFTGLVSGSEPLGIRTYAPVERVFNQDLPATARFLSFERKWNEWGANANWWYDTVRDEQLQSKIRATTQETYAAIGGSGYARMDLRMDDTSGDIYVVDVNLNCSLDSDKGTAMGLILASSGVSFQQFVKEMIAFALATKDRRASASVDR
ncbi:hypothetical protein BC832DRAFT_592915 [Gaertneriomyces semiglobifer]|nr:hypothetical protein BC832DRAFT_592915 [Gaertneriomyces semiglobifer]